MKLTLLGTGSFISSLEHFGPGYLLEIDNKKILIDAGAGTQIRLLELGVKLEELDYIFITHFHGDHVCELNPLTVPYQIAYNEKGLAKELQIFGPEGISDSFETLYRVFGNEKFLSLPGIKVQELNTVKKIDSITVTPYKVEHAAPNSQAYRFEFDGKVIVFSGDTILCKGIEDATKDADLLIIDAANPTTERLLKVHITMPQIGQLCAEANVKKVVLSHLLPSAWGADLEGEIAKYFSGEIVRGKDLMEMEL